MIDKLNAEIKELKRLLKNAKISRTHLKRYIRKLKGEKLCFFNLQEKYDRGQKGFTEKGYEELLNYICEENY